MSEFDTREREGEAAAAQLASDPAFAALQASGAPVMAAAGDPLRVIYASPSALAAFGDGFEELTTRLFRNEEHGLRGLFELIESARHSSAPRLERLNFAFGSAAQEITFLCRQIQREGEAPYFAIAALGVRAAENQDAAAVRLECSSFAPRFLWRTDASNRFVDVTQVLADVVGTENADLLGRRADEAFGRLGLDHNGRFARALGRQESWSGIELDWPLGHEGASVPTTLGGYPVFDEELRFSGFRGYGVLHLDRVALREDAEPIAPGRGIETPSGEEIPEPTRPKAKYSSANVVPLRPMNYSARNSSPSANLEPPTGEAGEGEPPSEDALTPNELNAFEEIARALSAVADMRPAKGSVRDLMEVVLRASRSEDGAMHGGKGGAAVRHAPALLEQLPVGVLVARGANALYANRALLEHLGYPDVQALEADGGLARVFFGGQPKETAQGASSGSIEVLAQDGEKLDLDACVQTIDWDDGLATLITLRRARVQNARLTSSVESAELLAVLDAASDAIAILDRAHRICAVNSAFVSLFGADAAAFATQGFLSFIADDDQGLVCDRFSQITKGAEASTSSGRRHDVIRVEARARTGALFPAELTCRRIGPPSDGRICVALRDLTHLRRSNRELEAARLEAERASAAKTDFLAKVSHEIRTPLNAIIGFAEVMMEERFGRIGNERYKEYLKDVHASGTHVLSLVNDLLDISKIEAGKFELDMTRVDANAIISECVSIMQTQASRARVVMRVSLSPRLPRIRADSRSLKQILLNLLSNAVKFNEPGGQVIVSSALTDAGYVMLRVKDTGVGMSDEEIKTALEPFRQIGTARNANGTGLGLPVTKALIEANHASFMIKSRKNEGTLIEIAFPPPQVLAAE